MKYEGPHTARISGATKRYGTWAFAFALLVAMLVAIPGAGASIAPKSLTAVMAPGDSITETKTVYVPLAPPKVDVVFAFDLTGSMSEIIDTAKDKAGEILDDLGAIPGVDVQAGVMSYMDYPGYYESHGYSDTYGNPGCGDYAYRLDQAVTADESAVTTAISGLVLGCGGDGPQDYTRIFYETYADANVMWRDGAKRILVNFGDNVPHDNNLNDGVPGTTGTWSTGGDPGRDEIILNSDDLDLQTVLGEMATEGVVLLEAHTLFWNSWVSPYVSTEVYWDYWTGLTGGSAFVTDSATLVEDVVDAITDELADPTVTGLHLEASTGFESWLTSVVPPSHSGPTDAEYEFGIEITVPDGTPAGIYEFTISALDEVGVNYGDQSVMIFVYDPDGGFVTGGGWIDSPAGAYYPTYLPLFDGSYYQLFENPEIPWDDANTLVDLMESTACANLHLATVTSAEEDQFIVDTFGTEALFGKWLGGFQAPDGEEPAGGWGWVTGEAWDYTNWNGGEPNNAGGNEEHLEYWDNGQWNDEGWLPLVTGYLVEYEDCYLPTGKANFGFVSKYKKGATVPTGSAEFQFHAGDLNFHSNSYDWLVVTGSNSAKFKGVGTINGEGEYKFQIWAGDNDPDTFRIKIWYENGGEVVVYDNGMNQPISGGSIVIHTKKK